MIFKHPVASDPSGSLRQLVEDLNRFHPTIDRLPVFADNDAARAANLKVGYGYVDTNGFLRRVI